MTIAVVRTFPLVQTSIKENSSVPVEIREVSVVKFFLHRTNSFSVPNTGGAHVSLYTFRTSAVGRNGSQNIGITAGL